LFVLFDQHLVNELYDLGELSVQCVLPLTNHWVPSLIQKH
jgi:hypothetical protein